VGAAEFLVLIWGVLTAEINVPGWNAEGKRMFLLE
jgi:hypothetical protein